MVRNRFLKDMTGEETSAKEDMARKIEDAKFISLEAVALDGTPFSVTFGHPDTRIRKAFADAVRGI